MINEASIKVTRNEDRLISVAISMPIWNKISDYGHLNVKLPFLAVDTVAKDEIDGEIAIKEAIELFCIASERFGQGLEKELEALNWIRVNEKGEEIFGYSVDDTDLLLERILETGDNYANQNLEIA